jgi:DNA adenine methylase
MARLLPLIKVFGGKTYQTKEIISLMKPHVVYVEGFLGGANILLNKTPKNDIVFDTNFNIINLYEMLVKDTAFYHWVKDTKYSKETFEKARDMIDTHLSTTSLYRMTAYKFLVMNRMSFDGLGKDFSWSDRLRGGQPENVNAWDNLIKRLPELKARFENVSFNNCSFMDSDLAKELLTRMDVTFYLDPPYVHDTRVNKTAYGTNEMSDDDHNKLLTMIVNSKAQVILSGYDNKLYNGYLGKWHRKVYEKSVNCGSKKTKGRRIEVIWYNH